MANYKIQISSTAEKSLKKLPKKTLSKIVALIQSLAVNPFPANYRKLRGEEHTYRVRIGTYRIIYEVRNRELRILVLKVGHRKHIYR